VWRLSHLGAKLAFLRAGLGFGLMPLHMIEADLASGALVRIIAESSPFDGYDVAMAAIYRMDSPPGPAGRWFIERLKQEEARRLKGNAPRLPLTAPPGKRSTDGSHGRTSPGA
jgi:DNA-binding transcriptional LysR family regulator